MKRAWQEYRVKPDTKYCCGRKKRRHVAMMGQSSILTVVFLPWLTQVCSKSTPTPHATFKGGIKEHAGVKPRIERQPPYQQPTAIPPRLYRALSRRSMGRYVLATSSLVGECARVYAPEPLGKVASSLCNRFSESFASRGRDPRPLSRQKQTSGFSYDRFMSQDDRNADEDLSVDGSQTGPPTVPPNKYSRVSSSFLTRHGIGLEKAERDSGHRDNDLEGPLAVDADERPGTRSSNAGFTQLKTRNVFKSLAGLGRESTVGADDDLELLSDPEEDKEWDQLGEREGVSGKVGVAVKGMPLGTTDEDVMPGKSTFRRKRNLVDRDSDDLSALVNKLRLAEKAKGVSRNRRENRRSRGRNRGTK